MKLVYIAGCFRGPTAWQIQQNVRRAEAMGLRVAECGAMPLIPHKNTENFHGLLDDEFWIEGTLELMRRCDAVMLVDLKDLQTSAGTQGEVRTARILKLPVFETLGDLETWIKGEAAVA